MSEQKKAKRSLAGIAGIVAVATLISKVFGLVRQQAIAAAFGVGPAFDAYNYAYVIPGFLLILLGGINGPFHSAIVSVLSKRKQEEAAPLVETITTLVGGLLLAVTILLVIFADPLVGLVAPGLNVTAAQAAAQGMTGDEFQTLQLTHEIAVRQFRIMAPMAVLAGLIGIGFGTLNAADQYWLPSISPLFSSVALIGGLGALAVYLGSDITLPKYALLGGMVLAWGTLAGAILQWLVQVVAQWRAGLGRLRLRFEFNRPGVGDVMKVMGPATLSSGMLQINVYTDLFFASYIPQAAAALGYAGLLVQTPLGIISNMLLVPLLPVFSRLADPQNWPELKGRIRQGLILTGLTMLPLGALTITLAVAIVRVVYERGAFDPAASEFVAPMLVAYGIGMFVYLGRDVLVRVFYALGDGETPFRVSIVNIFLNALFDFLMVNQFGAPGLVLATVAVNIISMVALLVLLDRKINGLPLWEWTGPIVLLTGASAIAGFVSFGVLRVCEHYLGTRGLLVQLVDLTVSGTVGLGVFALLAMQLKLPEIDIFVDRLRQRFLRRS
ncbi:murein biosynthesis integral membrane protein MurJ [Oxynema aestuarii]|uniref:Probable lipid II flippase MurJ n=1 Tax=Oxynema aestuarii AP17 TaxID=2064643 RepID=A0A6H1TZZ2_9CYAN|nr:murein biosynthesis integral membrane protein MurJ [Oxynema aestuarii]QIZ71975.1 murein biosynthesis integral membrane protein MurJ [Oxynema aestuarii AP17]RMH72394.1 MAG: murein biosynthesis integral membrane protein MurJ [Cyanobacteria bacterium J007]